MASEIEETASGQRRVWSVSGMDCASCAAKIRIAVERLPGVEEVSVSVMSETLSVSFKDDRSTDADVERQVKALGYGLDIPAARAAGGVAESRHHHADHDHGEHDHAGHDHGGHSHNHGAETNGDRPWYASAKGRLVLVTGALLAAAWAAKFLAPAVVADWTFILACLLGLFPVARRALAALRTGQPFTIEMLMTIAAAGALVIGAAEEAALVVFLFAVGEVLEGVAADRARASIRALGDLVPKTARLVDGEDIREVPAAALQVGQLVLARPGDRIPADGEIVDGISGLDESPVTGESVPKTKGPGEEVFAGSINTDAALTLRVTRPPEDNTIARIIRLVEEAQDARAPTERFIDRFSRYYMPAIVGMAILVALIPPLAFGGEWSVWVYRALALLLIGCPCALVISVPASIASALSSGARAGLLFKGGAVLEAAARTTVVAFDKTGTLTRGKPEVTDIVPLAGDEQGVLAKAAAVEAGSSHPLAEAILMTAAAKGVELPKATARRSLAGRGASAELDGVTVHVGSPRFAAEACGLSDAAQQRVAELEAEGKTVTVVFSETEALGLIALRDEPRADAGAAIAELAGLGVRSIMLTGDNNRMAAAIAGGLGMDYRAELLPDGKVAALKEMTVRDHVTMVGDGINDAPALAAAHVGVAMGSGSDVALESADGALLRNRVTDIAAMVRLARVAMANIHQNITLALGLKAVFLVTSVTGYTGLWVAILADTGATVLVTLNALRLLGFGKGSRRGELD